MLVHACQCACKLLIQHSETEEPKCRTKVRSRITQKVQDIQGRRNVGLATVRYNETQGWVWLHTPTLNISFHVNTTSLTRGWKTYVASRFHKLGFCKRTVWEKTGSGYKAEYTEIQYDKRKNGRPNSD